MKLSVVSENVEALILQPCKSSAVSKHEYAFQLETIECQKLTKN